MHDFDIYFAGEIVAGKDPIEVKAKLGKLFKLSGAKLDGLFSGQPVRIKKAVNAEEAGKYRQLFLHAGGLISVLPAGSEPPAPVTTPAFVGSVGPADETDANGMELLPAHSGSLIDMAKTQDAYDLSRADKFGLSPAGAILPEAAPGPSFESGNIDHIQILPANSGSLEEFKVTKEPVATPNIDHLKTVDTGDLSAGTEPLPSVDIPSTEHLQVNPPNSGSLEDCVQEKPLVQVPDTSKIKLAIE